jgi:hypothetical protein
MKKITVKYVIHKGIEIILAVALARIFVASIGYITEFIENILTL